MDGQNHFQQRDDIRRKRSEIAATIAALKLEDEQLARADERIRIDVENADGRHLVNAEFLVKFLGTSKASFSRLINNKAKGFPEAVTSVDSYNRWILPEVVVWVREKGRVRPRRGA